MKRYFLFSALTVLFFIGYPGCRCDNFMVMRGISSIEFLDMKTNLTVIDGQTTSDSLAMKLSLELETLYANTLMQGTMPDTWALGDCEIPLANRISSMNVFSENDYNEIPAGQSLNSIFQVYQSFNPIPLTIDEFILEFNENAEYFNFAFEPFLMWMTQKPQNPEHRFTVSILDDSGNLFEFTSNPLTWN